MARGQIAPVRAIRLAGERSRILPTTIDQALSSQNVSNRTTS